MDSVFRQDDGTYFTNADAVAAFVEAYELGERWRGFNLPDIGQHYRFTEVSMTDRGVPLLLFEAMCKTCGEAFEISCTVDHLKKGGAVNRNCPAHRYQSRPAPRGAWVRGSQIRAMLAQQEHEKHRLGVVQGEVLEALDTLDVVGGPVPASDVLRLAAAKAYRGNGKQDQRVKVARHALRALIRRGVIEEHRVVW